MKRALVLLASCLLCACLRDFRAGIPCDGDEHCPFGLVCGGAGTCGEPGEGDDDDLAGDDDVGDDDDTPPDDDDSTPEPVPQFNVTEGARAVFTGDSPGWGRFVHSIGDVTGDGVPDVAIAHDDGPSGGGGDGMSIYPATSVGAVSAQDAHSVWGSSASWDWAGWSVDGVEDLTGNGSRDVLVSAPLVDPGPYQGEVYLLDGPLPEGEHALSSSAYAMWHANENNEAFGISASVGFVPIEPASGAVYCLAIASQIDGVGVAVAPVPPGTRARSGMDIQIETESSDTVGWPVLIGRLPITGPWDRPMLVHRSSPYPDYRLAFRASLSTPTTLTEDADLELVGGSLDTGFGEFLEIADLDGDGLSDLIVTATRDDPQVLYLFPGDHLAEGQSAAVTLLSVDGSDAEPREQVRIADLNGDDQPDLVVRLSTPEAGGIWVFLGPFASLPLSLSDADLRILRPSEDPETERFGFSFDSLGDIDGGGADDLLISGSRPAGPVAANGNAYIVRGEDLFFLAR